MRDHILAILDYARNAMGNNSERTEQLLADIEVEAMAALHGGVTYIVIEYGVPQSDTLFAITDLSLYLRDFNEDFGTDYSTMEEFNEDQIERSMYEIRTP